MGWSRRSTYLFSCLRSTHNLTMVIGWTHVVGSEILAMMTLRADPGTGRTAAVATGAHVKGLAGMSC